jgi:hypothetical protein
LFGIISADSELTVFEKSGFRVEGMTDWERTLADFGMRMRIGRLYVRKWDYDEAIKIFEPVVKATNTLAYVTMRSPQIHSSRGCGMIWMMCISDEAIMIKLS